MGLIFLDDVDASNLYVHENRRKVRPPDLLGNAIGLEVIPSTI